jgi:hypothetical protein
MTAYFWNSDYFSECAASKLFLKQKEFIRCFVILRWIDSISYTCLFICLTFCSLKVTIEFLNASIDEL